jgi:hypothetical protein
MHILNTLKMFLNILLLTTTIHVCYGSSNIDDRLIFVDQIMIPEELDFNPLTKIKIVEDKILFMNRTKKRITLNDTVKIFEYNSQMKLKYSFPFPDNDVLVDFIESNNSLFLLNQNSILKFNIEGMNVVFKNKYKLINPYNDIKIENDKLILLNSCYSCSKPGLRSLIVDTNFVGEKNYDFTPPLAFQMSYYKPNRYIEYYNSKFVISNIIDYKIKIFDINTHTEQHIERDNSILNNNQFISDVFDTNNYYYWFNKKKYHDSLSYSIGRIILSDFLNDTTLIVCYSKRSSNFSDISMFNYDIWIYNPQNYSWNLKYKDLNYKMPNEESKPRSLSEVCGGIGINYQIHSGYIITPQYQPLDIIKSNFMGKSYKTIYSEINEFYKLNYRKFSSFFIFKFVS